MNYTTQMDAAKKGIITPEMEIVAKKENITAEELRERVARGSVAIPANKMHKAISPEGVGEGLKTKINVNLGISKDCTDYSIEWQKVKMAVDMKAEAIMDLSCYGKTHEFRQKLIDECPAMIGTVPMYDAVGYLDKELADITVDEFLEVIEAHAKEGVDFMTIHAGINRRTAQIFKESGGRLTNIVSRGGSLIFAWMEMTGNENPFYEYYDKVLDILAKYDVTISLGDACRPGSTHDSTDASQITELIELGILTKRAWEKNVQVMVEGPGHMTIDEIAANMKLEKHIIDRRVHLMEEEGVVFKTKAGIETKKQVQELYKEFDRVVLACGSKKARDIQVPGRDAKGIYFAVDYLTRITKSLLNSQLEDKDFVETKDKNVLVIGGGDTGNDCVGSAIRLGCKSVIQLEMMPEPPHERLDSNPWPEWPRVKKTDYGQNEAIAVFGNDPRLYQTTVKEFIKDDKGNIKQAIIVSLESKQVEGRRQMVPVKGSEKTLDVDVVLIAAGFIGCEDHVAKAFDVKLTPRGNVADENYQTNQNQLYVAGDMRRGQSLVVWAIREGREVARAVDEDLMGYSNL